MNIGFRGKKYWIPKKQIIVCLIICFSITDFQKNVFEENSENSKVATETIRIERPVKSNLNEDYCCMSVVVVSIVGVSIW